MHASYTWISKENLLVRDPPLVLFIKIFFSFFSRYFGIFNFENKAAGSIHSASGGQMKVHQGSNEIAAGVT